MNAETTSYYQPFQGDASRKITCIFENPTWLEELHHRPVAGVAGSRLCALFKVLRNMQCKLTTDFGTHMFRHKVCIVNGARRVYSTSTSITDATYRKYVEENRPELESALENSKMIICFGDRAEVALKEVCSTKRYAKVYHLSDTGISRLCNLGELRIRYSLPESHRGLVILLIYAEYLARWYENNNYTTKFSDFTEPFRHNGAEEDEASRNRWHKIDIKRLMNQCNCSGQCCIHCGLTECANRR